jgi:hypothetical protein
LGSKSISAVAKYFVVELLAAAARSTRAVKIAVTAALNEASEALTLPEAVSTAGLVTTNKFADFLGTRASQTRRIATDVQIFL